MPRKLAVAKPSDPLFQAQDEYTALRFVNQPFVAQQAESVSLEQVECQALHFDESSLYGLRLADVRFSGCSFSGTNCEQMVAHRVEFTDCRLLGMNMTEGHLQDLRFRDCTAQLARFRFCTFHAVIFEGCNLRNANFQGANLSGVDFRRCDLTNAEFSQAKLTGADFRTSTIDGVKLGAKEVVGAVVDHFQAAYLASLLGLVIKGDDKD